MRISKVVSKLKANEIRNLSMEELNKKLADLKEEFFNLRFQKATGQLANPISIRDIKKDIARVKTVIKEQELAAANK